MHCNLRASDCHAWNKCIYYYYYFVVVVVSLIMKTFFCKACRITVQQSLYTRVIDWRVHLKQRRCDFSCRTHSDNNIFGIHFDSMDIPEGIHSVDYRYPRRTQRMHINQLYESQWLLITHAVAYSMHTMTETYTDMHDSEYYKVQLLKYLFILMYLFQVRFLCAIFQCFSRVCRLGAVSIFYCD